MKIKNRQQMLAIGAMAAVALMASDKLIITPLTSAWKTRASRIEELTKSYNRGLSLLQREPSLRARWANMKTNALPSNDSVADADVSKALYQWAKDSDIEFNGAQFSWKAGATEEYRTSECRADAKGNIQRVAKFLYYLEKDPLAVRVDDLEIIARDKGGQELGIRLRLSGLQLAADQP